MHLLKPPPSRMHREDRSYLAMETADQAAARLSRSPPHPAAPPSPPLSPNSADARWTLTKKQQAFDYFSRQFRRPQPLPVLHRAAAHPSLPPVPLHAPPPHVSSTTTPGPAPPACNRQAMYRQQPCYVTAGAATQAGANAPYYLQAQTRTPMLYPRVQTLAHDKAPATVHYQAAPLNNADTQQPRALQFPPAAGTHGPSDARPRRSKTLNLFPLHPTFAIPEKTRPAGIAGSATPTPTAPSASGSGSFSWEPETAGGDASLPLYDFLGVGR